MTPSREALVTGGCGFVGSALCRFLLSDGYRVNCYDILDPKTVNPATVKELSAHPNFTLNQGDIRDYERLKQSMKSPDLVIHAAAISSVDRSIKNPIETMAINAMGTSYVLEAARQNGVRRIHYVSTDEIFGEATRGSFNERSPIHPRSPYSAGKNAAEAILMAYATTYKMETTITNSANNYGAYQSPDKLIPRLVVRGLLGNTLPVYGQGNQIREWVSVEDHVAAIITVCENGRNNHRYCVGSGETRANMQVVEKIIDELHLRPSVIEYVPDRPGHDVRYALNSDKLRRLGWKPRITFEEGLADTIHWYQGNPDWWGYFTGVYRDLKPVISKRIPESQVSPIAAPTTSYYPRTI